MDGLLATVQQWIPVDVLIGLTVASVIGFIGSLIAIPLILVRLPPDYFDTRTPRHWMKDHHPLLRLLGLVVKNVVGVVLLLAGFAMLFRSWIFLESASWRPKWSASRPCWASLTPCATSLINHR
jgi:hypothetical protein